MSRPIIFSTILLILTLTACAQGQREPAPPEIHYGEDICVECNMIISDARFAAGYAYEVAPGRYESKAFDDIGGMLLHAEKHPEDKVVAWYVHDYESQEWLDATQAFYVLSPELPTPMGYGILAFADKSAAETEAADASGEVLDWEGLLAAGVTQGR